MATLSTIDSVRLREVVDAFAALSWPADREQLLGIAAGLGWTIRSEHPRGIAFQTGDAISSPRARAQLVDGLIAQVSIDVTDRIRDADAAQVKAFGATARHLRDELSTVLGVPVGQMDGEHARYTWDLDNRGRVVIAQLPRVVQLIVLQERYAEIERREEELGIPDDRDPSADLV